MIEVRCCCNPENLIGEVPKDEGIKAGLQLRELSDGTLAFDSNHDAEAVRQIPGFQLSERTETKTWKTWKKTWRK